MQLLRAVILVTIFIGLDRLGIWLSATPLSNLTVVWFQSGIGLISLMSLGRKGLAVIFLGSMASCLWDWLYVPGLPWVHLVGGVLFASLEMLQSWLAWMGIKKQPTLLKDPRDLQYFFWRICILPPVATIWAMELVDHLVVNSPSPKNMLDHLAQMAKFTSGNVLGMFILTPLYVVVYKPLSVKHIVRLSVKIFALLLIPVALSLLVYEKLIYFIGLFTIIIAVRYHLAGSVITVAMITFASILVISLGSGMYITEELHLSYVNLTIIILCLGLAPHYIGLALQQLEETNANLEQRVKERTQELAETYKKMEIMAYTDELTGLTNRRAFYHKLEDELKRANRIGHPFALAMLDLDRFKAINDTYGHQVGDAVIKAFSEVVRNDIRAVDVAARWGGEEFVILFPVTTLEDAWNSLERIRQNFSQRLITLPDGAFNVTVSVGLTQYLSPEDSAVHIIARADEALYRAKHEGRNKICTLAS